MSRARRKDPQICANPTKVPRDQFIEGLRNRETKLELLRRVRMQPDIRFGEIKDEALALSEESNRVQSVQVRGACASAAPSRDATSPDSSTSSLAVPDSATLMQEVLQLRRENYGLSEQTHHLPGWRGHSGHCKTGDQVKLEPKKCGLGGPGSRGSKSKTEHKEARKTYGKNKDKMEETMRKASDAVVRYYLDGDHSLCGTQSLVCSGQRKAWGFSFLPDGKLENLCSDISDREALKKIIAKRLGEEASEATRNRVLQRLEAHNHSPGRTTGNQNKDNNQPQDETEKEELRRLREEVAKYKAAEEQQRQQVGSQQQLRVETQHQEGNQQQQHQPVDTQHQVGNQQQQQGESQQRPGDNGLLQRQPQPPGLSQAEAAAWMTKEFHKALDARMKELAADGVGTERRQADPLTQEDEDKPWTTTNAVPSTVQPSVHLWSGNLGVVIFPSQLLNAELTGESPTAYSRKLMDVYFTKEVLAVSRFKGNGKYAALDEAMMAAVISKNVRYRNSHLLREEEGCRPYEGLHRRLWEDSPPPSEPITPAKQEFNLFRTRLSLFPKHDPNVVPYPMEAEELPIRCHRAFRAPRGFARGCGLPTVERRIERRGSVPPYPEPDFDFASCVDAGADEEGDPGDLADLRGFEELSPLASIMERKEYHCKNCRVHGVDKPLRGQRRLSCEVRGIPPATLAREQVAASSTSPSQGQLEDRGELPLLK
ncbi:Hypp6639 [Branchiostoma lanceolatum]|uniref:Hypp6639 protein n=1 Tax=Branchiostoma lanceolatum TaxID=7740 RepID=A0A8J9YVB7_BRALA|nr:Hypp6639 [Branchiostoma lanceolatum]